MDRIHGAHELGWKENYVIFSNLAPYYKWLYKFRNVFSPTVIILHQRSHHNEEPTHCNEEWPPFAATREKPVQQ